MVHADIKYKYNFIHTSPLAVFERLSESESSVHCDDISYSRWLETLKWKRTTSIRGLDTLAADVARTLTAPRVFGMRCVEHSILLIFVRNSLAAFHMHFTPLAMVAADDGWWLHQTHLTLCVLRLCPIAASTSSNIIIFILL